jgi:hypothetical protein
MGFVWPTGIEEMLFHSREKVRVVMTIDDISHSLRYSVLPALSLDGIIAANVVEGSFNAALFSDFVEGLLDQMQPFPRNNSVVVMDNCRIHKDPAIVEMIEERSLFHLTAV